MAGRPPRKVPRPGEDWLYNDLVKLSKSTSKPLRDVQRAKIVVMAIHGHSNMEIAKAVHCSERTVQKWRKRFIENPSMEGLRDAPRPGRPAIIPPHVKAIILQLACDTPKNYGYQLRALWTQQLLARVFEKITGFSISTSEIQRVLQNGAIRPHRTTYWMHSPDPDFRAKVKKVCDVYHRAPKDAVVLCIDEKPIQVLGRRHPNRPGPDGKVKVEYEYIRRGTNYLFGALNVRTGKVFCKAYKRRRDQDTFSFMKKVAKQYPDKEIFVVWDNLSTHIDGSREKWTMFNKEHGNRFHFVYTPIHASWVNQIECWFSILQRELLRWADFKDIKDMRESVYAFIREYNMTAKPFRWNYRGNFGHEPIKETAA